MPFLHCTSIWTNFCFYFATIFFESDFNFSWLSNKTLIILLSRLPLPAIRTAAALSCAADPIRF